jgi:uncharacterized cupin superfamily protein
MASKITQTQLGVGDGDRFQRLRAELGVTSFGLNHIVLRPGERGRIHAHTAQEEVYIVLEGTLTLIVDAVTYELRPGGVAHVPGEARRQLINHHREPVALIAIGGMVAHEHQGRDALAFNDWEGPAAGQPQDVPLPENLPEGQLHD